MTRGRACTRPPGGFWLYAPRPLLGLFQSPLAPRSLSAGSPLAASCRAGGVDPARSPPAQANWWHPKPAVTIELGPRKCTLTSRRAERAPEHTGDTARWHSAGGVMWMQCEHAMWALAEASALYSTKATAVLHIQVQARNPWHRFMHHRDSLAGHVHFGSMRIGGTDSYVADSTLPCGAVLR